MKGDKQFLETPWYGSRQMARHMKREGHKCGRHRVCGLMRLMRSSNSIEGKGAWRDNRMMERLWRSLKYECVYLNAVATGSGMWAGIGKWLTYYNSERPHSTHAILPPG